MPVNYNNSIIYKICCKDPDIKEEYVGSTTNFTRRKNKHKNSCNNINIQAHHLYVYVFIRNHGGWDNWDMIAVKEVNVDTKRELETIERRFIEDLGASLNKTIPTRTPAEYRVKCYEENKEEILEKNKEYYEKNKDKIFEYQGKYRVKYYIENKSKIDQKHSEYRQQNKEKISKRSKEKVECDCGCTVTRGALSTHRKSKKHIKSNLKV